MKHRFLKVLMALTVGLALLVPAFGQTKEKLTVWGYDIADDDPGHLYIKNLVQGFQSANPNIQVEYVALGDPGLKDKTKIAMASNMGPDLVQTWGGSVMGGYADAGRLLDLTNELKDVPGSAAARQAMSWKGKIYGVAPFFAIAGMYVNEDVYKANNLKVPTTLAELEKVCDVLVSKHIQPFACGAKDKWPPLAIYMYLVNRYGSFDAFDQATKRKAGFDSEVFVKAALKYQEWIKKGYFGSKPLGEAYGDAKQLLETGKAGMMVSGSWLCSDFSDPKMTDQRIGFYGFPDLPGGKGKVTDVAGMTDIGFFALKKSEDKKDAIVKFMKYAMSVPACSKEPGRICSVPGVKAPNYLTGMAAAVFTEAKDVQFWWDQDLPPTVTTPLNDTIQTFFLPNSDVKASLKKFEALVADRVGPVKK